MTTQGKDPAAEPGVSGTVGDTQRLVKQHLELFRHDVREGFPQGQAGRSDHGHRLHARAGRLRVAAMLVGLLVWAVPAVAWSGIVGAALMIVIPLAGRTLTPLISPKGYPSNTPTDNPFKKTCCPPRCRPPPSPGPVLP